MHTSPAEHFSKGLAFMNLFTPSNLFRCSYHFITEGSETQKLTPESELGSGKSGLAQGIWYIHGNYLSFGSGHFSIVNVIILTVQRVSAGDGLLMVERGY